MYSFFSEEDLFRLRLDSSREEERFLDLFEYSRDEDLSLELVDLRRESDFFLLFLGRTGECDLGARPVSLLPLSILASLGFLFLLVYHHETEHMTI